MFLLTMIVTQSSYTNHMTSHSLYTHNVCYNQKLMLAVFVVNCYYYCYSLLDVLILCCDCLVMYAAALLVSVRNVTNTR
jgi:hypothetical protein